MQFRHPHRCLIPDGRGYSPRWRGRESNPRGTGYEPELEPLQSTPLCMPAAQLYHPFEGIARYLSFGFSGGQGAPCWARTSDLLFVRKALYPTELTGH